MDDCDSFEYIFKVVLIGDMNVGKTCVVQRFNNGTFEHLGSSTIGVDFAMKNVCVDGKRVKLQIWDTGGHEQFRTITKSFYRSANGIVLCYDITSRQSFESIPSWIDEVTRYADSNVVKILVATKSDLVTQRVVQTADGIYMGRSHGMLGFLETSAKENTNVDAAFHKMAQVLKRQYDTGSSFMESPYQLEAIRLDSGTTPVYSPWDYYSCCQYY